jgi:hypothetical protein
LRVFAGRCSGERLPAMSPPATAAAATAAAAPVGVPGRPFGAGAAARSLRLRLLPPPLRLLRLVMPPRCSAAAACCLAGELPGTFHRYT